MTIRVKLADGWKRARVLKVWSDGIVNVELDGYELIVGASSIHRQDRKKLSA